MSALTKIFPAYPYSEYLPDDDIEAFFISYNELAQYYLDWFNQVPLSVYTNSQINGLLLDWIAQGIYNTIRPTLASNQTIDIGSINTFALNTHPLNYFEELTPTTFYNTTDDIFKRILTWNFYKGDGFTFNIEWLKRRVLRFLIGANGIDPGIDQTYQISVSFSGTQCNINILNGIISLEKSSVLNSWALNTIPLNYDKTQITYYTPLEFANILISALNAGVLNLPFQFTYSVAIIL